MSERVFVTGANGRIGVHLVRELAANRSRSPWKRRAAQDGGLKRGIYYSKGL